MRSILGAALELLHHLNGQTLGPPSFRETQGRVLVGQQLQIGSWGE